jgi:3-dehydroquinate synthase
MKITKPKFVSSIGTLCTALSKQLSGRRYAILTDETVGQLWLPQILESLHDHSPLDIIEVESGELCKSPEVCIHIWQHLLELEFSKSDVLVCIGGGSVSDLGGFIAATYKRGLSCIFLPTTLLAMTDAAVGGKNGIDISDVKNAVGTIVQPEAVLVYPKFCGTLSDDQFLSGMAEVFKHGVIAGGVWWKELQALSPLVREITAPLLRRSVGVKLSIVREDPLEKSRRKVLNFGHTIGHAIESSLMQSKSPVEHGFAVAMGMMVEVKIAERLGMLPANDALEIIHVLRAWYTNVLPKFPTWSEIVPFLSHDKKVDQQKNAYALPLYLGCFEIVYVEPTRDAQVVYNEFVEGFPLIH